jgi:hypothetical protein
MSGDGGGDGGVVALLPGDRHRRLRPGRRQAGLRQEGGEPRLLPAQAGAAHQHGVGIAAQQPLMERRDIGLHPLGLRIQPLTGETRPGG